MTRVLVLGRQGQLARALHEAAWPEGWVPIFAGREHLDLTRLGGVAPFIRALAPDIIINAAAYTAVDKAESEPEAAHCLNADAPEVVAEAAQKLGALMIHLSTDYVFGGVGDGPFKEDDPVAPVNVYGRTKAEGELRVINAAPDAVVARTAWLMSADSGFVQAILQRALQGVLLRVVVDQQGNPTLAADLATALIVVARTRLLGRGEAGLLHMAGPADAIWAEVAQSIATVAIGRRASIERIASTDFEALALRPRDSRLSVTRMDTIYGIKLAPWPNWIVETARDGLIAAAKRVEKRQQSGD